MTEITYYTQDNEISLEAIGHSGFAETGSDIVCAGISTLTQTLVAYLEDNADHCDYEINEGYLFVYSRGGDSRVAFDTILTGLELLSSSYPEYLSVARGCTLQTYPSLV